MAEGRAAESDVPDVKESSFRYPGPKPSFRESAIISLADAVESASRTLSKPTPQKIEALVEEIVRSRLRDGQLDECDLTLRDLRLVKESFTKTLRTSLHRRIPYPDEKEKEERKDETRAITERMEERYATETFERPRRGGSKTATTMVAAKAPADQPPATPPAPATGTAAPANNIIHMPAPPPPPQDKSAARP